MYATATPNDELHLLKDRNIDDLIYCACEYYFKPVYFVFYCCEEEY